MEELEFNVLIEQDEDGIYIAKALEIEGCCTQGKTMQEVFERIKEAIEVCLEGDKESVNPLKFIGIQKIKVRKNLLA